jgi:hypothetical protein
MKAKSFDEFLKLKPNYQLDFILGYLNNDKLPESIQEIETSLGWDTFDRNIDKSLNVILDKLIKDGFVLMKKMPLNYPPHDLVDSYYISFEGKVLSNNKGYEQKSINEQAEKNNETVKLVLHYAYYIVATIVLFIALVGKSCSEEHINDFNYKHNHHHRCKENHIR